MGEVLVFCRKHLWPVVVLLGGAFFWVLDMIERWNEVTGMPSWIWAALGDLLVLVAVILFFYQVHQRLSDVRAPAPVKGLPFNKPLTQVLGQTFKNIEIQLDGYDYINCQFDSCRFRYDGKMGARWTNSGVAQGQHVILNTSDPACQQLLEILRGLMAVSDGKLPEIGRTSVPPPYD